MSAQNLEDLTPEQGTLPSAEIDASGSKFEALPAEIVAVIESYMPERLSAEDTARLDEVMPTVRSCVLVAKPETVYQARRYLWATTRLALWWNNHFGNVDVAAMFHPHNVLHFVTHVNRANTRGLRTMARSVLQNLGPKLVPELWPLQSPKFRDDVRAVPPYSASEEVMFAHAALLPERGNRVGRIWVVAASFGAGMTGREISASTPADLTERDDGRIVVTVRGLNARSVPIRASYTAMAREAVADSDGATFFLGSRPDIATNIAQRLPCDPRYNDNVEALSLRRARNTWLTAHLAANTMIGALRAVAGPISAKTLDTFIAHAYADLDPDRALEEALKL